MLKDFDQVLLKYLTAVIDSVRENPTEQSIRAFNEAVTAYLNFRHFLGEWGGGGRDPLEPPR